MYPFTSPRVRFSMQPDSTPPPRRGRRAARSRATPQNNDDPTDAQPAATSSQMPDIWGGLFGGDARQPGLPGLSNAAAASSSQAPGILNGLSAGNQPQPVSPLPGSSNTAATNNDPLHISFDGFGDAVPNAYGINTTDLAGGALTPALAPFGLGLGFASSEPPWDPRHNPTWEELDEDMRRYPGTSREWLNNRAMYFTDEVYKARKAGRQGAAKDLVRSAQELNDPNDRYTGSVYVDDPDRLAARRLVDPHYQLPRHGQEDPEPRSSGSLNADDPERLVDLAFNRPQRGRGTRRAGIENHEDTRKTFVNPYLSILEPGEQAADTGTLHSDVAVNRARRGREPRRPTGTGTEIPAPEIVAQDDDYEYIRRSHRRRSPSPSPSTSSSSSSITSSSPSVPSSDEKYEEALRNLNSIRRTFGEQLCVPLTRLTRSDVRSFTPESFITVARLAMGGNWARMMSFGVDFMRVAGFQHPDFNVNAEAVSNWEELLDARNLTRSERVDLELMVEDLKDMLGEE